MINVNKNTLTEIFYTASELDTATASTYILSLKSYETQQITGITISDISTYTERYNKSKIYSTSILESYIVSTHSIVDTNDVVVLSGDIDVPAGATLSVNGYIIMSGTYSGNIISDENITLVSSIDDYYSIDGISIITRLNAGFYDYTIKNILDDELEYGIFRIIDDEVTTPDVYIPDNDTNNDDVYIPD